MLSPEKLKYILPSVVTRIAIQYPIAYIDSVSFLVKNTLVAACFWSKKQNDQKEEVYFGIDDNEHSGCYIYASTADIQQAFVEITGKDESGQDFLVSVPYQLILQRSAAA
ncbi:MAG: hypothetical protein R2794_05555 [Chitinophagales bacterium]